MSVSPKQGQLVWNTSINSVLVMNEPPWVGHHISANFMPHVWFDPMPYMETKQTDFRWLSLGETKISIITTAVGGLLWLILNNSVKTGNSDPERVQRKRGNQEFRGVSITVSFRICDRRWFSRVQSRGNAIIRKGSLHSNQTSRVVKSQQFDGCTYC